MIDNLKYVKFKYVKLTVDFAQIMLEAVTSLNPLGTCEICQGESTKPFRKTVTVFHFNTYR